MRKLSNRTEFDRQWEEAFRDAEMAPPENVWDKVDSALSKEEAGYFKKRAFLFKLLAAASIAFALGVGLFSINYVLDQNVDQVAQQNDATASEPGLPAMEEELPVVALERDNMQQSEAGQGSRATQSPATQKLLPVATKGSGDSKSAMLSQVSASESNELEHIADANIEQEVSRDLFSFMDIQGKGIQEMPAEEMIFELDHIYLIPIMPKGASKIKKEKEAGIFLAGLDFSTGIFDPNFQVGGGGSAFANVTPSFASDGSAVYADARVESVNNQLVSFNTMNKSFAVVRSSGKKPQPKVAFSYGANVGFKLSRRILVQSGLAYRKANTTTTTTGYLEEANSDSRIPIIATYQYQLGGLTTVNPIDETNLNNEFEFLSVPLRLGYILMDRKINLSIMAGISSEFYLSNQIKDASNYLETLSIAPGEESPYKNVYFNGTLGTMLGYSFARNYAITVEPGYRFALNSFTKEDFYLNSQPSSFMLSFGVAYNFK